MADGIELLHVLGADAVEEALQVGERGEAERDLVDDAVGQTRRTAGDEHDLVMVARIAAEERELDAAGQEAAIGDGKAEDAMIEVRHLLHVGDEESDMAELECEPARFIVGRSGVLIHAPCPRCRRDREA